MDEERPRTSIQPPSRAPWIALGVAVVVAVGGALYWLRREAPPPVQPPAPAPVAEAPAQPTGPAAPAGDARSQLDAVSSDPAVRRLLADDDLARRWATATDNVAEGIVPRKLLAAFAPSGAFGVVRRGGQVFVDAASYRRYDGVGDVVGAVNVDALAAAYRILHPALETAYRALGYPEGSIDRATARALARIEGAPVREGHVEVVPGVGTTWAYADPQLEQLPDVERQMLRMGPRNERIVQEKARALSRALALPAPAPAR